MDTRVTTNCGIAAGFTERGVRKWLGIPYAQPPVGELRYRRARAGAAWQGVKDCRAFGNKPVQFLGYSKSRVAESEDCLYLNVWRPDNEQTGLPVFVWIYGGGFAFGESSDPGYDGSAFARQGVIFVSFNYRLGPLGYYPFKLYAPANFDTGCGLSDQIAALKWIRENIAAFGGDPNNVTVAGESAGASSVCYLMASPAAQGLFNKAIAQSAIPAFTFSAQTSRLQLAMFAELMGMRPEDTYKLRDMPAAAMKKAAKRMFTENSARYPGMGQPGPTFDDLLPELATQAAAKGKAANVKLLIGTNRNEGTLFYFLKWFIRSWEQAEKMCRDNSCADKLPLLKKLYAGEKSRRAQFAAMATDRLFLKDSILLADVQSRFNDVYMYRFDYVPRLMRLTGFGATHSCEIAPALGTFAQRAMIGLPWLGTPARRKQALQALLNTAWVNFAKTGDPNGGLGLNWEKYDEMSRKTLIIGADSHMESDPDKARFDVWKDMEIYT